jgi:hypothetical protein
MIKIKKEKLFNDPRRYVFIDLTPPFQGFTQKQKLIDDLNEFIDPRPIILIKDERMLDWVSRQERKNKLPIMVIYFNRHGQFEKILGGSDIDQAYKSYVLKDLSETKEDGQNIDLADIRKTISQFNLYKLLIKSNSIELPENNSQLNDPRYFFKLVRTYQVLKNGMLVSCYLNLKYFGHDIEYLMDAAYEVFLNIENYFIDVLNNKSDFSYIITTNNTALFIASLLQTIYEDKYLVPIDKLGPIPSLRLHSDVLSVLLKDKKVILFEEVAGSGSEIDRGIMFLNHMHADINRVISLYDLQVGKSLLINDTIQYYALCTPKEELKYEYRSK